VKRKGENFATKEDFEALRDQLRSNTRTVEGIRSEFGQRDWAAREWATIKRTKLEELVKTMHACREYLQKGMRLATSGKFDESRDQMADCESLTALYFPSLVGPVNCFTKACRELYILNLEHSSHMLSAANDNERNTALAALHAALRPKFQAVLASLGRAEDKAVVLMQELAGMAKQSAPLLAARSGAAPEDNSK
jgi:hypothetical protein